MIAHDDRRVIGWASAALILLGACLGAIAGATLPFGPAIAAWLRTL